MSHSYVESEVYLHKIFIEAASIISVAANLFIMISILLINRLQSSYNKLIFFLGISNFIYSSSFLLSIIQKGPEAGPVCLIQGSMMLYGFNASVLVILTISYSFFQTIVNNSKTVNQHLCGFMVACFIVPGLITAYFLYERAIVPLGPWCSANMDSHYIQSTVLFHGLYMICVVISSYFYVRVIRNLKAEYEFSNQEVYLQVYSRIKWYPVLLIICFTPLFVLRHMVHFGVDISQWFLDAAGVLACLNGFLNGIFYGLNKNTRKSIRSVCCKRKSDSEIKEKLLKQ